ncbi:MAG: hypothetical protein AAF547_24040, partial [Actinomycetota bacterium]
MGLDRPDRRRNRRPGVVRQLGAGFTVWFQKLLQLSMTTGAVGEHVEFGTLADHALTAVADATGVELADDAWPSVAATIGSIQPHPEVPAALDRLRNG